MRVNLRGLKYGLHLQVDLHKLVYETIPQQCKIQTKRHLITYMIRDTQYTKQRVLLPHTDTVYMNETTCRIF